MGKYITDLDVSINSEEEKKLKGDGFTKINVNLNEGVPGNKTFLWYKKGDKAPITRVQVSFNQKMKVGLEEGYTKISNDLNAGTSGKPIYMWYSTIKEDNNPPIVDVNVTIDPSSEDSLLMSGGLWEQVSCDLNLGAGGKYVYAWVKRERPIYICDVTVTNTYDQDKDLFSKGYTRVDVNTNLKAPGTAEVFIWYNKTTDEQKSLSGLNISTTPEQCEEFIKDGFQSVDINLNENTGGAEVHLWWKKVDPNPEKVRGLVLLLNMEAVKEYKAAGVKVIEKSLNSGNRGGATIYMCYV